MLDADTIDDTRELMVVLPRSTDALAVFTAEGGVEPLLKMVRAKIDAFEGDASTAEGRKEIKAFANKIVKAKTALEEIGSTLAAEQKKIPTKIDAARRLLKDTLDKWRDEVREPVDQWEEAERQRVEAHKNALAKIESYGRPGDITAAEMRTALEELLAIATDVEPAMLREKYVAAKSTAEWELRSAIARRETYEAQQAELAKLRAEAAERAAKDREEELRREGEARAQREAEAKAEAERQRVEAERLAGIKREEKLLADKLAAEQRERDAKLAAEQSERDAKEREKAAADRARVELEEQQAREKAEAQAELDRREADTRHRRAVNRAAINALVAGGIDDATAKAVIKLIVAKAVPAVSIAY